MFVQNEGELECFKVAAKKIKKNTQETVELGPLQTWDYNLDSD